MSKRVQPSGNVTRTLPPARAPLEARHELRAGVASSVSRCVPGHDAARAARQRAARATKRRGLETTPALARMRRERRPASAPRGTSTSTALPLPGPVLGRVERRRATSTRASATSAEAEQRPQRAGAPGPARAGRCGPAPRRAACAPLASLRALPRVLIAATSRRRASSHDCRMAHAAASSMRARAFLPRTSLACERPLRLHRRQPLVPELDVAPGRVGDLLRQRRAPPARPSPSPPRHVERQAHDEAHDVLLVGERLQRRQERLAVARRRARRAGAPCSPSSSSMATPTRTRPRSSAHGPSLRGHRRSITAAGRAASARQPCTVRLTQPCARVISGPLAASPLPPMTALRAVKGMNDVLPDEIGRWQRVERAYARTMSLHGFREVRTPYVEPTAPLRARHRRDDRRRREGDVLLRPPRRAAHAAPRGDRRRGARVHRARRARARSRSRAGGTRARCSAPSGRSAGATGSSTSSGAEIFGDAGPGCDAEMIDMLVRFPRASCASRTSRCSSTRSAGPRRATRYREALVAVPARRKRGLALGRLAAPPADQSPAHPRLEGPARSRGRSQDAPTLHELPRRRRPRALRRAAPAPRRARHAVHGRPEARPRPRLLHAHALRDQRRAREARRREHARRRRPVRLHGAPTSAARRCRPSASRRGSSGCSSRASSRCRRQRRRRARRAAGRRRRARRSSWRATCAGAASAARSTRAARRSRASCAAPTRSARASCSSSARARSPRTSCR